MTAIQVAAWSTAPGDDMCLVRLYSDDSKTVERKVGGVWSGEMPLVSEQVAS